MLIVLWEQLATAGICRLVRDKLRYLAPIGGDNLRYSAPIGEDKLRNSAPSYM